MTLGFVRARSYVAKLIESYGISALAERLKPHREELPAHIPRHNDASMPAVEERWNLVDVDEETRAVLLDSWAEQHLERYTHNIENLIGTVNVPTGVAGPLRVNGLFAKGDYYVPLATTVAGLVASFSRGAGLITEAGGASVAVLSEGVSRAPMLAFENLVDLGVFVDWVLSHLDELQAVANPTTRFGKLEDAELSVEGTKVYFLFIYSTGDGGARAFAEIAAAVCLAGEPSLIGAIAAAHARLARGRSVKQGT